MPTPTTVDELLDLLQKSKLIEPAKLNAFLATNPQGFASPKELTDRLATDGYLTAFHVQQLLRGKHRGFFLGKYKILDRIGLGGMGQVFLAEHTSMWRRVAIKVLPPERAKNPYSRQRFLREARAAGQLDHPNLVRSFDFDGESEIMFLVMEYVDGASFHELVHRAGPLPANRVGYYLWQAAHGLAYLNHFGLIHRDIKPANLLLDRQGVVKILDLGLVRTEEEQDALTRGEGVKMLGTADYFAPEQAIDCSKVDVRADLYSLGATGYFLATGRPPFEAEHLAQKLIAHQLKPVVPVTVHRPDFSPHLTEVITKLLAKSPTDRYQTPGELIEALASYATVPPPLPTVEEIPINVNAGISFLAPRSTPRPGGSDGQLTAGSSIRYHSDSKLGHPAEAAATAVATAEVLHAITPAVIPALPRYTGQGPSYATPVTIAAHELVPPTATPRPQPALATLPAVEPTPAATPLPPARLAAKFIPPTLDASQTHGKPAPKPAEPLVRPIVLPEELLNSASHAASTLPRSTADARPDGPAFGASAASLTTPRSYRTSIALGLAFLLVFGLGVWVTLALSGPQTTAAPEAKIDKK